MQVQKPSTCRLFHPSSKTSGSSKSKSRSKLHSTIFDADEEIDWDAEDDDDTFDIQSNSIHESDNNLATTKDMDKSNGNGNVNVNGKSKDMTTMDLNDLDDTDESYYEQLFLLQKQNLSQGGGNMDSDADANEDDDEKDGKENQIQNQNKHEAIGSIEIEQESHARAHAHVHNYEYKQKMALQKEWKEKVHQMRNESIQTRKFQRQRYKRGQLEERASFLALRALRLQNLSVLEHEHENENKVQQEGKKQEKNQKQKLKQKQPVPSLSISSMRNYKRKGDELDKTEIKLEQKMYGKRFKNAQGVYIRLFEVLEDMRMESVKMASEMIADRLEEEVSVSVAVAVGGGSGGGSDRYSSSSSSRRTSSRCVDDVTKMNEFRQSRMNTVVHLSLNGRKKDVELSILDNVDTDDLLTILRIRGNVKRRGRTPKTRSKVLEYVEDSFTQPLF